MFPHLYKAADGSFAMPTYGALLVLAFAIGATVGFYRMRKVGIHPDILPGLILLAIGLGIFGARLLHFLGAETQRFFRNPFLLFNLGTGGMAVYGGVIAASVGCFFWAKRKNVNPWKLSDALLPCFFLSLAVGRIACIAAGCCHGSAIPNATNPESLTGSFFPGGSVVALSDPPFLAFVYNPGVGVGRLTDVACYPTQLWECLAALTLFFLLSWTWSKKRFFDGQIVAIGMIAYPIVRSSIEAFRGDSVRGVDHFGLFSTSQLVSVLVAGCGVWIFMRRKETELGSELAIQESDEAVELELFDDL